MLNATVAYAEPGRELLLPVRVEAGATLRDAVLASGLLAQVPALAAAEFDLGVWGHARPSSQPVRDGDRIEVYRPLTVDPKQARRIRAEIRQRRRAAGTTGKGGTAPASD